MSTGDTLSRIRQSVFQSGDAPEDIEIAGASAFGGVSDLAVAAVRIAVEAAQRLCSDFYGRRPPARVDRGLVDHWCMRSFVPDGWELPPAWDPLAADYPTRKGWVRLHTNAPHHRDAALTVLGGVTTPEAAQRAILEREAGDLVEAIVAAGGCASELFTSSEWCAHPQGMAVAKEPVVAWTTAGACPAAWAPRDAARPLAGLRVLDLTRIIAGPVATRFLASLGAEVLRIDPPGWSEGGNEIEMSLGKTCAELDLRSEAGRARFAELLKSAHVMVHGYRKDALQGLGFSSETLTELNPGLITVGLTAYGWSGPWAGRRGFDSLVQRSTGLAVKTGGKVADLPYQVLDHATGYLMAAAVLEALRRQAADGQALHARLSLARQAMLLLDLGENAKTVPRRDLTDRRRAAADWGVREVTPWGPGWRLPLPYGLSEVRPGWARTARGLRQDPARWPGGA